ncbi:hypothetical protein [Flavobacterium sp.]|uniref:hypothetical protein n=1 Tax=Flavobacterium sp. TaxID=239 RepID=UPI002FD9F9AF
MKNLLLILLCFMFSNMYCQQASIVLADGTEKTGDFVFRFTGMGSNPFIKDKKTKEKYKPEDILSFKTTTAYGETIVYYAIDVQETVDDKKTTKRLGYILYENNKVKLFSVINNYVANETYILRKKDTVAFNIGYIYGADARPFRRRIREYFTDCPELVSKVEKNDFHNTDAIKMAQFYDENCGK